MWSWHWKTLFWLFWLFQKHFSIFALHKSYSYIYSKLEFLILCFFLLLFIYFKIHNFILSYPPRKAIIVFYFFINVYWTDFRIWLPLLVVLAKVLMVLLVDANLLERNWRHRTTMEFSFTARITILASVISVHIMSRSIFLVKSHQQVSIDSQIWYHDITSHPRRPSSKCPILI